MKAITWGMSFILAVFIVTGCTTSPEDQPAIDVKDMTIENVIVPADFNYATSKNIEISLTAPETFKGAVFMIQTIKMGKVEFTFGKGAFDTDGTFSKLYTVNSYTDTIRILSGYVGLTNQVDIPIVANQAKFDYRPFYSDTKSAYIPDENSLKSASAGPFTYLASFNSSGVPSNLTNPDAFQQNFYDDVNASLPEYKPVPSNHPEYLAGKESNLVLTKTADVWVTFVAEGAGWRNAIGFYTNNDPSLKIIFPNASQPGSGGALSPGSKVHLGQFPANTVISWFLVANGWNGSTVTNGNGIRYSDPSLNTESNPNLKQHIVLLYDKARFLTLIGFEDMGRESGADNDFNDAIFYASSNPVDAVQTSNMSKITAAVDSDGDGINDAIDDFPFDPDKAFNNYAPSNSSSGSVAYEDLWPSKGDYDFNDLVVSYNFNQIANSKNLITSLEANFTIDNIGGSYKNGFAIVLPIPPAQIASVENQVLNVGYAQLDANGTEKAQGNSVIIVAENTHALAGQTIPIIVKFKNGIHANQLGGAPYDPFIIVNGDRSREVHLADMAPTALGGSMLGQKDDYSNSGKGRYYKTNRNLPWALNIYGSFSPPSEKVSIDKVYPKFIPWANSGGTLEQSWYK